jgi:hypothetical protein
MNTLTYSSHLIDAKTRSRASALPGMGICVMRMAAWDTSRHRAIAPDLRQESLIKATRNDSRCKLYEQREFERWVGHTIKSRARRPPIPHLNSFTARRTYCVLGPLSVPLIAITARESRVGGIPLVKVHSIILAMFFGVLVVHFRTIRWFSTRKKSLKKVL